MAAAMLVATATTTPNSTHLSCWRMTPALRRSVPALVAVTAVALVALVVARRQPDWALVGASGGQLAFELASALGAAVAGVMIWLRGSDLRSGGLLVAAAAWDENPKSIDAFPPSPVRAQTCAPKTADN